MPSIQKLEAMKDLKKPYISRREFIGMSVSSLVSAGIYGCTPEQVPEKVKAETKSECEIVYRGLGRTGFRIPIVSMGEGAGLSPKLTQVAYEKGMRHFDTAADYQRGRNEYIVGDVINRLGIRDKVIIGTKIFSSRQRTGLDAAQLKNKAINLIDKSLKRLQTDYVDILYLHSVTSPRDVRQLGLAEAMQNLVKLGKARAIGLATHTGMASILNEAAQSGIWDVVVTAYNFTMADDTELKDAIDNASENGVGVIAMKTQAGGSNWPDPVSTRKYSNSTINRAALKWAVNNKNITTTVPGIANFDQLNENWQVAVDPEYTEIEKEFLDNNEIVWTLAFCRQCRQCLASCPNDVEIPALMRTHMYAAQYGDFRRARMTLDDIPRHRSLSACTSCSECVAGCAHKSVDIASNLENLKLVFA